MVGFFPRTPLGGTKKKKVAMKGGSGGSDDGLVDLETFVSPAPSTKATAAAGKSSSSMLAVAPPLFRTFNDTDHQLLKNMKRKNGGRAASRRNSVHDVSPGARSVETARNRLFKSASATMFCGHSSLSASPSDGSLTSRAILDNLGLSPFVGRRGVVPIHPSVTLPSKPPLLDDDDEDGDDNEDGFADATATIQKQDTSKDETQQRLLPPSIEETGSDSFSSLGGDMNRIINSNSSSSIRSLKSIQQSPAASISSLQSQQLKHQLSQHFLLDESFIEEVIEDMDDILYYEEEIIEDENGDGQKRRKVRFDDYDEMQFTLHLNDYTAEEVQQSWYKRDDYDGMISAARIVAQKEEERRNALLSATETAETDTGNINDGDDTDSKRASSDAQQRQEKLSSLIQFPQHHQQHHPHKSELETRGLESWSPSGALRVRKIKEAAIEAVWDEQHRQWEAGVIDLEQLRNEYQKVSFRAQKVAEERGYADQQVAERIRQMEELETSDDVMMKRKRAKNILVKGRNMLGKSVTAAVGKGNLTKLLESIKNEKKRRDDSMKNGANQQRRGEGQRFRQPSFSCRVKQLEAALLLRQREGRLGELVGNDITNSNHIVDGGQGNSTATGGDQRLLCGLSSSSSSVHELDDEGADGTIQERADKLRRLGVLNRHLKRHNSQSGFATWEEGLAAGGKL
jgi:hypothetical protein